MRTFIFSFLILYLSSEAVSAYNCNSLIRIEGDGLLNHLGNITFVAPEEQKGPWTLVMKTDVSYTFIGGWKVWVQSDAPPGVATFRSRSTEDVEKGDLVTMRFRVSWARDSKRPRVISLIWNDIQICR